MGRFPLILFGEVLFDCFPDQEPVLGGAPFNVAWHLRGFCESPNLVSAVGDDDSGNEILARMEAWSLSTQGIARLKDVPTGRVNITLQDGEPTYEIQSPVAYDYIPEEALTAAAGDGAAMLYHGTLALRNGVSRNTLLRWRSHYDGPVFLDVNLRDPWWSPDSVQALLEGVHTVKLNLPELGVVTKCDVTGGDWRAAAENFRQHHNLVNLLVTRGEAGASVLDGEGVWHDVQAPPLHQPITDAVGAGDAFAAVCILGMKRSWDWSTTLERAQQFASFIVTQRGATCPDRKTYRDFQTFWGLTPAC